MCNIQSYVSKSIKYNIFHNVVVKTCYLFKLTRVVACTQVTELRVM